MNELVTLAYLAIGAVGLVGGLFGIAACMLAGRASRQEEIYGIRADGAPVFGLSGLGNLGVEDRETMTVNETAAGGTATAFRKVL